MSHRYAFWSVLSSAVGLLLLLLIICFSPDQYRYDEWHFVGNIPLFHQYGFSQAFLTGLKGQSPGPLYQWVHVLLKPATNLNPVRMRLVNFSLLLLSLGVLRWLLCRTRTPHKTAIALLLTCVPMMYVVGGMALTEVPAMLFAVSALACLRAGMEDQMGVPLHRILGICGGLLLGMAIAGRTPYLMVLAALPLLLQKQRKEMALWFLLTALPLPLYMFYTWQGLLPPDAQEIQSGFQPHYAGYALGYMGLSTLFVCYRWLVLPKKWRLPAVGLGVMALTLNLIFRWWELHPVASLTLHFPTIIQATFGYLMAGWVLGIGVYFLAACIYHLFDMRQHRWQVFLLLAGLLLLLTTLKSSAQFSSRYVVQALPFFLLAYKNHIVFNRKALLLQMAGVLLGLIALAGYFFPLS